MAGALVLKLRQGDFQTTTRRKALATPTAFDQELLQVARALLTPALAAARARGQAVRLLGVAATNLRPAEAPELFESAERGRQRDVVRAIDSVRARFGFEAVRSGRLIRRSPPED